MKNDRKILLFDWKYWLDICNELWELCTTHIDPASSPEDSYLLATLPLIPRGLCWRKLAGVLRSMTLPYHFMLHGNGMAYEDNDSSVVGDVS